MGREIRDTCEKEKEEEEEEEEEAVLDRDARGGIRRQGGAGKPKLTARRKWRPCILIYCC